MSSEQQPTCCVSAPATNQPLTGPTRLSTAVTPTSVHADPIRNQVRCIVRLSRFNPLHTVHSDSLHSTVTISVLASRSLITPLLLATTFAMLRLLLVLVLLGTCVTGGARPFNTARGSPAELPVLYPDAELHGRLPTACAIDEAAGELIVIDDHTRILALSLEDGRVLRQVDGVVRLDLGAYAVIHTLAVQPRDNDSSLLWLSVLEDQSYSPGSLLVVDSRDLSTIVFTIAWDDTSPPIQTSAVFDSLHASTHGELMHALVVRTNNIMHYVFNTTTGQQVDSYHAPNGAAMLAVSRNSSTGDEQLVFVLNADEYVNSLGVTQLDGAPLYILPIVPVPPIQQFLLADFVAVDSQQRLWLMDEVNTLHAFNLTTGQQVSNVSWSLSDDIPYAAHIAALGADGARAYVSGKVSAYTVVIDTSTGKQVAQWHTEQRPLLLPYSAAFDDSNAISGRHIVVGDTLGRLRGQLSRVSLSGLPLGTVPVKIDDGAGTTRSSILVDYASGPTHGDLWMLTQWDSFNGSGPHSHVYHFTGNGSLVGSFEAADSRLVQLAWGPNHSFWAAENTNGSIQQWSDTGSLLSSLKLDGQRVWGVGELSWLTAEHDEVTVVVSVSNGQRLAELSLNSTELRTIDAIEGRDTWPTEVVVDTARRIVYSVTCNFTGGSILPEYCWVRALHQLANQSWVAVAELHPQSSLLAHPWFISPSLSGDGQQLLVVDGEYNRLLLWNVTAVQRLVEQSESADAGSNSSKQRHAYVPSSAKRASQLVEQ